MKKQNKYTTGEKYFSLTLKSSYDGSHNYFSTKPSIFICDCGNEHTATLNNVVNGVVKHCTKCSLIRKSKLHTIHGHSSLKKDTDPIGYKCYYTWQAMKRRCYLETDKRYLRYGGRGITVCESWKNSYENFVKDMGIPPSFNHSIDRIDNNGNYEPNNCRWVENTIQANNKSNNRNIIAFGKTQTLMQWADETGIKRETIAKRLNSGKSPEIALSVQKSSQYKYVTPKGSFISLKEVCEIYGLKNTAIHSKFESNKYPEFVKILI